jgi:hypothetical protein
MSHDFAYHETASYQTGPIRHHPNAHQGDSRILTWKIIWWCKLDRWVSM